MLAIVYPSDKVAGNFIPFKISTIIILYYNTNKQIFCIVPYYVEMKITNIIQNNVLSYKE